VFVGRKCLSAESKIVYKISFDKSIALDFLVAIISHLFQRKIIFIFYLNMFFSDM